MKLADAFEEYKRVLTVTSKASDAFDRVWLASLPAERVSFTIERACQEVSAEACKGIVVPELDPSVAGSHTAPMLRFAAECAAKRRFDIVLFTKA